MRIPATLGEGDWTVRGRPSAGARRRAPVVEEYARLAPEYETRWSRYIDATLRETLVRLELRGPERVLDLGCGTGALLRRLNERFPLARYTGLDPVPEMLAVARGGLPARVGLCEGWAERLPFAGGSFDVVVSTNMFHYVRQPKTCLEEIRRVLRPGGGLVLTDWCDDYFACRVCDFWLRWTSPAYVKTYRSSELRGLLGEAGFLDVSVERYKIGWLWGLMTARAR